MRIPIVLFFVIQMLVGRDLFAENRPLTLSYIDHPDVTNYYLPLIKAAYADRGIEVNFIAMSIDRGLLSLKQGLVDGDVVRATYLDRLISNFVFVAPKLGTGYDLLVCQSDVPATKKQLLNADLLLGVTRAFADVMEEVYGNSIKAKLHVLDDFASLESMFLNDRIDCFISVATTHGELNTRLSQYQTLRLEEFDL